MLHDGHRERLRTRFVKYGEESFCDHELLELLLFYSLPRVNTNETAHRLLEAFGSLEGIFNASIEELDSVKGIGRGSAILIRSAFLAVMRSQNNVQNNKRFADKSFSAEDAVSLFESGSEEKLFLVSLNAAKKVLGIETVCTGEVNYSDTTVGRIVKAAVLRKARFAVLVHNHPRGVAIPSQIDIIATQTINQALKYAQIDLIEHYVVCRDRTNGIIHNLKELNP